MKRKRAQLTVSVDLDPVPGAAHTVEDWQAWLQGVLNEMAGHYHPVVTLVPDEEGE